MLVLQNTPGANSSVWDLAGVEATTLEAERTTSKFDLTLFVVEREQGLDCALEYSTDLFEAETMRRMLSHFQTLLEGIVDNPQARLSDLPLVTTQDRERLLSSSWGARALHATGSYAIQDVCLHHLFEQQVERTPDTTALVFEEEVVTYADLNRRANQLAHALQRLSSAGGLPTACPMIAGGVVGICMQRSIQMIVALLAVLKAGATYLPLDPAFPQQRLAYMMQDAQVSVLLTQSDLAERLATDGVTIITESKNGGTQDNPSSVIAGDQLAYIIYTSGSTGKPKGVMIRHSSVVNYTTAMCQLLGTKPGWQYALVSTLSADLGNTALFCALASGGCVQVLDAEVVTDAQALSAWFEQHPVDVLKLVPSHLSALLTGVPAEHLLPGQALLLGGEALPASLLMRLRALGTMRCKVYNHYGPTETTIGALVHALNQLDGPAGVVGRPLANTEVYLLESRMQLAPTGVPAEVYLGGAGLGRGYMQRPEMTAEYFVPHPFAGMEPDAAAGARLYRTGDLACYRVDGTIDYLGSIDHQGMVRCYRIELEEIESVLQQHTGVCAVICVLDTSEDKALEYQLIAYVVPKQERPPTGSDLRGYLQAKLPAYMVPSSFVMLDALPLMPNGKVDRRALPKPDAARSEQEVIFIPPRTLAEEVVADIWDEILHVEQIGVYDNFFALGGHSLQAARIVSWLRDAFQVALSVRSLFEQPTIDGLVRELAKLRGGYSIIEEIALILKEIQQLSEEEMQDILK